MRNRLLLAALVLPLALATGCGEEDSSVADGTSTPTATPTESPSVPTGSPDPTASASDPAVPSESASAQPTGPACRTVWVDGKSLPKKYAGCVAGGEFVKADRLGCSSGQRIVRYDDRFWAYDGGPISKTAGLKKDEEYVAEVTTCRG